jgi:DUF177 domain-containing protein
MSDRLPEAIDPIRLADQQKLLKGRIPLSRMRRLGPSLAVADGWVEVDLGFGVDDLGIRYLGGRISAELQLVCQRCMEPMALPVAAAPSLGLVRSDAEAERLPSYYEPLVVGSEPMLLSTLVEDELILALPIVPVHPADLCPARSSTAAKDDTAPAPESAGPFAVLAALKNR